MKEKFAAITNVLAESTIFNVAVFLLSSVCVGAVSLLLAYGDLSSYLFVDYFITVPLIALLNIVPVVLLQLFFLCVFNRQWLAFLLNALIVLGASLGNFYKLLWRSEPFIFSDITAIGAGLRIAGIRNRTVCRLFFCGIRREADTACRHK